MDSEEGSCKYVRGHGYLPPDRYPVSGDPVVNCLTLRGGREGLSPSQQLPLRKMVVCTGERSLRRLVVKLVRKRQRRLQVQLRWENAGPACRKPRVQTPAPHKQECWNTPLTQH